MNEKLAREIFVAEKTSYLPNIILDSGAHFLDDCFQVGGGLQGWIFRIWRDDAVPAEEKTGGSFEKWCSANYVILPGSNLHLCYGTWETKSQYSMRREREKVRVVANAMKISSCDKYVALCFQVKLQSLASFCTKVQLERDMESSVRGICPWQIMRSMHVLLDCNSA